MKYHTAYIILVNIIDSSNLRNILARILMHELRRTLNAVYVRMRENRKSRIHWKPDASAWADGRDHLSRSNCLDMRCTASFL